MLMKKDEYEEIYNSNLSMFSIFPIGVWNREKIAAINNACGFWVWDATMMISPKDAIFFTGEENEVQWNSAMSSFFGEFYKALSVRCIRENNLPQIAHNLSFFFRIFAPICGIFL